MPATKSPNTVDAKIDKLDKSFNEVKNNEVEFGSGGELPSGLSGVAKLVEAKLEAYKTGQNQGELYQQLRGVIIQCNDPLYVGGQVMVQTPLVPDPASFGERAKTEKEAVDVALNEIRKLGFDTSKLQNVREWRHALDSLKQAETLFRFHTFAGTNPQTKQLGKVKHYIDREFTGTLPASGAASGPVDNTGKASNGQASSGSTSAPAKPRAEDIDWTEIGSLADSGDEAAQNQITAAAKGLGWSDEDIGNADKWSEVAAAVSSGEPVVTDDAAGSEPSAEAWKPVKGDSVQYKAPGPGQKVEEYVVTASYTETLNLKRKRDDKTFMKVPWSADPPKVGNTEQ